MLWCAQSDDAPLQIGALCLFEGAGLRTASGRLRLEELRRHLDVRFRDQPRTRSRLARLPLGLGAVWVDDERFDVAHHVHAVGVPSPGGDRELRELVAHLVATPLDPGRPLWEVWVLDGLDGDRVGLVLKASHVMADGSALLALALSALDVLPRRGAEVDTGGGWVPEPVPGPAGLAVEGLSACARTRLAVVGGAATAAAHPVRSLRRAADLAAAAASFVQPPARTPVTGPVGTRRDFAWVRLPMAPLAGLGRAHGATVNDVLLAVVAGALRRHLAGHGEPVDVRPRVVVPVSTHVRAGDEVENRFSLLLAPLPVDVADPTARLRAVRDDMARRKASIQREVPPVLFAAAALVPPAVLHRLGPWLLSRQGFADLAVTDLSGTGEALHLLGSRLLEAYPFVTVTGNLALIAGVLSYGGGLGVGLTVDPDVVEDLDGLVDAVRAEARSLTSR